tara:strand:- start:714 stop:1787 length:1074 start_codon:yes stop_codon:yes gene_type:complete
MEKNILIIGSQGNLGSRLSDYLQEFGHKCSGIDTGFFEHGLLYPQNKKINMIRKDARDIKEKDLDGFEVLIQLAGISNDPFGNLKPEKIYDPTRNYAIKIAKMCKKLSIRYIFPSSCSVYGIGEGMLDENGPTAPQTHYSLNKLQIEQDLEKISDESFSPIALRLATVFGMSPRIRFDIVINMLCGMAVSEKKILLNSNGQSWRPHLDIEDVCEAFRCCIEWDYSGGKLLILNVGRNDNNWKIIDIAKLIKSKVAGCKLNFIEKYGNDKDYSLVKDKKIQDGVDKRTYQVNFDLIEKILPKFKCHWDIENGIDRLISDLDRIGLSKNIFKLRDFYRLQQIEFLHKNGKINDNLFWTP